VASEVCRFQPEWPLSRVESSEGEGSRFTVRLHRYDEALDAIPIDSASSVGDLTGRSSV
jgi:hypothetical protein